MMNPRHLPSAQYEIAAAEGPREPRAGNPARTRHLLPPSDGTRYRQLTLALDMTGGLTLTFHEMGASEEAAWGGDDCEITLEMDSKAVTRLAFAMLCESLAGETEGLERLRAFCEAHEVQHTVACWT